MAKKNIDGDFIQAKMVHFDEAGRTIKSWKVKGWSAHNDRPKCVYFDLASENGKSFGLHVNLKSLVGALKEHRLI